MRSLFTYLLSISLLALASCDYEPEGINPVEVAEPDPDDIPVTLSIKNAGDTVYMYGRKLHLTYISQQTDHSIENVDFFINTEQVASLNSQTWVNGNYQSSFDLSAGGLPDGIHTLKAVVLLRVNHNSLSGANGLETIEKEYEWTLVLDTSPPPPTEILIVAPYRGSLKVCWNAYPRKDFVAYYLDKRYRGDDFFELARITDPNTAGYIDRGYVGGKAYYRVRIETKNHQTFAGSWEDAYQYNDASLTFYPVQQEETVITLPWSKSRYPLNFYSYTVYRDYKEFRTIFDVADTVITDTLVFGEKVNYQVFVNSVEDKYDRHDGSDPHATTEDFMIGKTIDPAFQYGNFEDIVFRQSASNLFFLTKSKLHAVDPGTGQVEKTFENNRYVDFSFALSNDATVAYSHQSSVLYSIDPSSLSVLDDTHMNDLSQGTSRTSSANIWVNNNNLLFIELVNSGLEQQIEILDMNQRQSHSIHTFYGSTTSFALSSEENYFVRNHTVYQVTADGIRKIRDFPVTGDYIVQEVPDDPSQFMVIDNQRIRTFAWADGGEVSSVDMAHPLRQPTIDVSTGYVGGVSANDPGKYLIVDYRTGKQVRQLEVAASGTYYFYHSTLFSDNGYYLPLSF